MGRAELWPKRSPKTPKGDAWPGLFSDSHKAQLASSNCLGNGCAAHGCTPRAGSKQQRGVILLSMHSLAGAQRPRGRLRPGARTLRSRPFAASAMTSTQGLQVGPARQVLRLCCGQAMSGSKGKLRHSPAHALGMHREEEQVAPQRGVAHRCQPEEQDLQASVPRSAASRESGSAPCRPRRMRARGVSQQPPATKVPSPSRSSWPYLLGASFSLRHVGPDMPLPGCCLIGALINHLLPAFLAAADVCLDGRALVLPSWEGSGEVPPASPLPGAGKAEGEARSCLELRDSVGRSSSPEKAGTD